MIKNNKLSFYLNLETTYITTKSRLQNYTMLTSHILIYYFIILPILYMCLLTKIFFMLYLR